MIKRVTLAAALLMALMLTSGCLPFNQKKKVSVVVIDPLFSMNIGDVNPAWPTDIEELTEGEKDVYTERGTPDFVHIIWSKRNHISSAMEIHRLRGKGAQLEQAKKGWIYLDKKEEVIFHSPQRVETIPLSDKLDAICEYGDLPEPKWLTIDGIEMEKWHYMGAGVILYFVDDTLYDKKRVQPMQGFLN